jgi:hypothetical protein
MVGAASGTAVNNINQGGKEGTTVPGGGGSGSGNENGTGENSASPLPSSSRDGGGGVNLPGGGSVFGGSGNNFKMPAIPPFQKQDLKKKVPTGVKNISKEKTSPIPAEADAVPSKTYRAIISSKMLKGKAGTIGGIASGQGNSECGSFFNKGDNRVLRTVYKEDIQSQSVSSLSFNPVKWVCAACPKSHPVFRGGGGPENRGCDC